MAFSSYAPFVFVAALFLYSNGTRLRTVRTMHDASAKSLANSTVHTSSAIVLTGDEDVPPLGGCEENFFDKTCCCFIDAGILKQDKCICTNGASSCQKKIRLSFHHEPSREIATLDDPFFPGPRWKIDLGYIKGYQAVEKDFCMAAPVVGPEIDSRERNVDCMCSTDMGSHKVFSCGTSCNVENCQRTNPYYKPFLQPFLEGRGKCCQLSYSSAQNGCEQEVEPLTESGAKTILTDALKHAQRGEKTAFILSQYLVPDMTSSFETAKQKQVSTSRSGAEFFFSGDYNYILKSIHKPEYEVLQEIAQPAKNSSKRSLPQHMLRSRQQAELLGKAGDCLHIDMQIALPNNATDRPTLLAEQLQLFGSEFRNDWTFDLDATEQSGKSTFLNTAGNLKAVWCEAASAYRISEAFNREPGRCEELKNDVLHKWLRQRLASNMGSAWAALDMLTSDSSWATFNDDVNEIYEEFIKMFEEVQHGNAVKDKGRVIGSCTKWWPSSLINEFVLAFEYKDSTWMVVRNSVSAIHKDLQNKNFEFHKSHDVFDVKPFPIHSDQRKLLFGMHFLKDEMRTWTNWLGVRKNLINDVQFMNSILDNPMVDYSLLVSAFYINDERKVLDHVHFPNCVEERLARISSQGSIRRTLGDYGDAEGSILVCFSIIDFLMEFTFSKTPENVLLFNKWSDWGSKIMNMFDCLGNPSRKDCESYKKLESKFNGVDIPSMMSAHNPKAYVQDLTDMIDADGVMKVADYDDFRDGKKIDRTYKCCCNADEGICKLEDTTGKSGWSLIGGDRAGCGALAGKGWHSYWRESGSCILPNDAAYRVRGQSVVVDGALHHYA